MTRTSTTPRIDPATDSTPDIDTALDTGATAGAPPAAPVGGPLTAPVGGPPRIDFFSRRILQPAIAGLTNLGISIWGSRVLEVPGRTSGVVRRVPVNLLTVDGQGYLVAPRGHTNWVRNVRANDGGLTLKLGRRRTPYRATELADADKEAVLRAYLARWKFEVGVFFDGVDAESSADELARIAPNHPVFAIAPLSR